VLIVDAAGDRSATGTAGEYRAAGTGTILADRSNLGRLSIRGRDALDLLHRLTTNSVKDLGPGEGRATVFTTAKGRIRDLVVIQRLEEEIFCIAGPGRAAMVAGWIGQYTFREEVAVSDRTATHGTLGLYGARAAETVAALLGPEAARGPRHHVLRLVLAGVPLVLCRALPLAGEGFHLTAEAAALPALRDALLGAVPGPTPAGPACLEILRVEAGLPEHGLELTEAYNPWEAGLDEAISLTKGCYVGQEVIARLNTYDKVSRRLVRLRLEGATPPPAGSAISAGEETIGTLTSAAVVPGEGRVVALGYVRDESAVPGVEVRIDGGRAGRAEILGRVP
jgi:folate-binding protein YgfZ